MRKIKILLADNNKAYCESLSEILKREGYDVIIATNPEQAERELSEGKVDMAIIDMRLRDDNDPTDKSGLDLIKETKEVEIPKIILTGYPSAEAAREALKPDIKGIPAAVDFVSKDEGPDAVLTALAKAQVLPKEPPRTPEKSSPWLMGAIIAVLISAAFLVVAFILKDVRWLTGTILLVILVSVFYWLSRHSR